jgi:tRNA (guanine-N7-)-methyltransferase
MHLRRRRLEDELSSLFPKPRAFVWEVGCGHGHFLTAYAAAHPQSLCIGIDIASDRIERALRKRDRARLGNLFFIQAEARLFVESLPAHGTFSDLFILFPDPWPKLRHRKHRVLQPDFLSAIAPRAASYARLCFRTDHSSYFQEAVRVTQCHPDWGTSEEPWPFEFGTVFQSRAAAFHSFVARRVSAQS